MCARSIKTGLSKGFLSVFRFAQGDRNFAEDYKAPMGDKELILGKTHMRVRNNYFSSSFNFD